VASGSRSSFRAKRRIPANASRIRIACFFDFTNAATASSVAERIRAIKSPLVKGIRVGVPSRGVTRVVLELVGEPRFSSFPMYDPFRLVVDLEPTHNRLRARRRQPRALHRPPRQLPLQRKRRPSR
jgi:hypothetical protein